MFKRKIKTIVMALLLVLVVALAGCSSSKTSDTADKAKKEVFPEKPITWVIPFDAGSGADTFARTLGKCTEKQLGQNFVYLNKPGGSGGIALSYLQTQPTDGYTIASHSISLICSLASGELPFKMEEINFISRINQDPQVLVVAAKSKFKTAEEFIAYCKENPGKVNVGGVGAFSNSSICSSTFCDVADISYQYIPYDGGNELSVAVMGSTVDVGWITSSNVTSQVESGLVRILATANDVRSKSQPDVPTLKELGYDMKSTLWRGIISIPGIPADRQKILEDAFAKALEDPEWLDYMKKQDQLDAYMTSKDFTVAATADYEDAVKAYKK